MRSRLVPILLAVLALAVAAVVAVVLVGRGDGGNGGRDDGLDFLDTPYYEVLYDADASAADVVEVAESPDELVELDDGTEVRLYGIQDQEGGDAAKAAVQVRREGADPVARLVPTLLDLTAAGDHAVLHSTDGEVTTVDADGTLTEVTRTVTDSTGMLTLDGYEPADGVEPGDVLVGNSQLVTLYRPSTRTVHEVPLPEHDKNVVPLVAVGGGLVWIVEWDEQRATVRSSSDGESWETNRYDLDGASPVAALATDDTLVVLDASAPDMVFEAATVHVVTGSEVRTLTVPDGVADAQLARTPSGRLLVGSGGTWLVEQDGELTPFDVPGDVWSMAVAGPDLVALGDREDWTSADDGASWQPLDD